MTGESILHYQILEMLGEGGMGRVYLATDSRLGRKVALKFLPRAITVPSEQRQRFLTEAKAAAALNHPNIAQIHAIEDAGGELFIVMEYIEGQVLDELISANSLSVDRRLEIARQLAAGLKAAHQKGIIHRDIKPGNIILDSQGNVKITDFGLAKIRGASKITKDSATLGTIAYSSPEQLTGGEADECSDIWSYGVVLYELFTGKRPFEGLYEQALMYAIFYEKPNPVSEANTDIPEVIEQIIKNCLEKEPDRRYPNFGAVTEAFDGDGSLTTQRSKKIGSQRIKYTLSIALALTLFFLTAFYLAGPQSFRNWLLPESVPAEQHLTILPFKAIGDAPGQAFSEGLVETISSKLTQLEGYQNTLWVVPTGEVKEKGIQSASEAYQTFGANLAVTGSVQELEEMVRLTLNLIDAKNLRQLKSVVIDVSHGELASLQNRSVTELLEMLDIQLHPNLDQSLREGETTIPGAFELYLQGRAYLMRYENSDHIDIAIKLFREAIDKDPAYALAYAALGESYWRKFEAGHDTAFVALAEKTVRQARELNNRLVPVDITLGIIHLGTGDYEEAVSDYTRALGQDPKSTEAHRGLAKTYEVQGELDEAEETYKKAIRLKPDYWAGYNDLGIFYYTHGRYEEAISQFRHVVNLTPDNYRGYSNLGGLYLLLEQWQQAREMLEQSLALEKTYFAASNLGSLNYIEGKYADAARMYEIALELNPNNYSLWGNLAAAYYWTPKWRIKSGETYRHAIGKAEEQRKINPSDPDIVSNLGAFYAEVGDTTKAIDFIEQSLDLGPDNLEVAFRAATTYERLGDRGKALYWIEKALKGGYSKSNIIHQPELQELVADQHFQSIINKNP